MESRSESCKKSILNYKQWVNSAKIRYSNEWFNVLEKDSYFTIEHKEAQVMVLPIVENSKIILVKARRPVLGKSLWELPAGGVKHGECYNEAARREMAEETGIKIENLSRFHECQSFVLASNRMPMFPRIFIIDLNYEEFSEKFESDNEIEQVKIFSFYAVKKLIVSGELYATLPIAVVSRFFFTKKIS